MMSQKHSDPTSSSTPLLSPDFSVQDAEYDLLFQTLPSSLVSNVLGVFGAMSSGKSSLINELIRVKALPHNTTFATGGFNGNHLLLTPEFVFAKGGRAVNYNQVVPSIRLVKPLPACTYYRLLTGEGGILAGGIRQLPSSTFHPETNPYSEQYQRGSSSTNEAAPTVNTTTLKEPLLATVPGSSSGGGEESNMATNVHHQKEGGGGTTTTLPPPRQFGLPQDPLDSNNNSSSLESNIDKQEAETYAGGVSFFNSPNAYLPTRLFGGPPLLVITNAPDQETGFDAKAVNEQQQQWKSKLDQICSLPISNPPAESSVSNHITHTVCLDIFEGSKTKADVKATALDTIFGKCDSVVGSQVFHKLTVSAGVGGILESSGDSTGSSKSSSSPAATTTIPTSLTLVNASGVLQELHASTLENARKNHQMGLAHTTISRISKEKHRMLSSAIVEFTYGNKDPFSLLPKRGGNVSADDDNANKKNVFTRLFSRGGDKKETSPFEEDAAVIPGGSHDNLVGEKKEILPQSTRTSAVNKDAILSASSIIRSVDKLLYCLPVNQLPAEEAAATFFKMAFQVAVEGKSSAVLDPAQLALANGIITPDERILQVQPVATKLDIFCSVHRHGVDLALVTAKKAASALYERYTVPAILPLADFPDTNTSSPPKSTITKKANAANGDGGGVGGMGGIRISEEDTPSNKPIGGGGIPIPGVRPRTVAFHPTRLPKPIVIASDGFNGFLPDASRELDRAPVFLGNKKKYEVLPDIMFERVDTYNLCDWLVLTKLNLLKSRGGRINNENKSTSPTSGSTVGNATNPFPSSATPTQQQGNCGGTVPTLFASDSVKSTAEKLRKTTMAENDGVSQQTQLLQEQLINLMGRSLQCASF